MVGKRRLVFVFAGLGIVCMVAAALAQTGVLRVNNDRVKIGGDSSGPNAPIEVIAAAGTIGTGNAVALLKNAGDLAFQLDNTNAGGFWNFASASGDTVFRVSKSGTGGVEMELNQNGNLTIRGSLTTTGCTGCGPDYVFQDDYDLMSLSALEGFIKENHHLPRIPSAAEMEQNGINQTQLQLRLLEKIEELTLHTLAQQKAIEELQARLNEVQQTK